MVIVMSVVSFVRRVQNPILSVPCFLKKLQLPKTFLIFFSRAVSKKLLVGAIEKR